MLRFMQQILPSRGMHIKLKYTFGKYTILPPEAVVFGCYQVVACPASYIASKSLLKVEATLICSLSRLSRCSEQSVLKLNVAASD